MSNPGSTDLPMTRLLRIFLLFLCGTLWADTPFPAAYTERIDTLSKRHPNWRFLPYPIDDLDWEAILKKECTPGWNLVVHSSWAPGTWRAKGLKNYTPYYDKRMKPYDSGIYYQASREAIAYFLDPRNFLNEIDIFMFEALHFSERSHTVEAVEVALEGSFMANARPDTEWQCYSELLVEVGRQYDISPVFLAGRLKSEQGMGSDQSRGTIGDALWALHADADGKTDDGRIIWGGIYTRTNASTAAILASGKAHYNGYYNLFNMDACGSGVFEIRYNAYREATAPLTVRNHLGPWDSQRKAIIGGALKMRERYIDTHRHTRYFQKFSVCPEAGESRWSQYMQNLAAPLIEARTAFRAAERLSDLDTARTFVIPVYRGMPETPAPDPAEGQSVYSADN